jgi:hypothetical protein
MKQENSRCDSRKKAVRLPKTSHAGIIRIGFEGISQPHFVEHPCFNILIESFLALFGNLCLLTGVSFGAAGRVIAVLQ